MKEIEELAEEITAALINQIEQDKGILPGNLSPVVALHIAKWEMDKLSEPPTAPVTIFDSVRSALKEDEDGTLRFKLDCQEEPAHWPNTYISWSFSTPEEAEVEIKWPDGISPEAQALLAVWCDDQGLTNAQANSLIEGFHESVGGAKARAAARLSDDLKWPEEMSPDTQMLMEQWARDLGLTKSQAIQQYGKYIEAFGVAKAHSDNGYDI